jgi:TatD DNase family protein
MNRLKQLITEIHRRSLWQVLLIYIGAALVAYQAVQALTEGLGLPQWFPAFAIILFIVGLPIVLATAFVREVEVASPAPAEAEPRIVEAEADAARDEASRHRRLLTWRNAGLSFVAALAVWGVVGEIGLDGRSKVPMEIQQRTMEAVLAVLTESPRLVSVHSFAATGPVLDVIGRHGLQGVVLHWWRGTESQTRRALDLGCYFSINAAEVAKPKVLDLLPRDRVLTETDHPFGDRHQTRPRRPGRVSVVEDALARCWGVNTGTVRRQVWDNFRRIAIQAAAADLLPEAFQRTMLSA